MLTKTQVIRSDNVNIFMESLNKFIKDKKVENIQYQTLCFPKSFNKNGVPLEISIVDCALVTYIDNEEE